MSLDIYLDAPASEPRRSAFASWLPWLLVAGLVGFVFWQNQSKKDDDTPNPSDLTGFRVLIVEETEKRSELTQGQIAAMDSTKVRNWLNENCEQVDGEPARLKVDSEADVSKFQNGWPELRAAAVPPYPCYVTSTDGKIERHDLMRHDEPDRFIQLLQEIKDGD